jgi:ABC-type lipoprotein release transport system permease subunit
MAGGPDDWLRADGAEIGSARLRFTATGLEVGTVGWVFGAAALVVLALALISYRLGRRSDDHHSAAIVGFILGADLLVLAVNAALT